MDTDKLFFAKLCEAMAYEFLCFIFEYGLWVARAVVFKCSYHGLNIKDVEAKNINNRL